MQIKLNYKLILIFIFLVGAFTSALFQIEGQDDIDGTIDSAGTNNPAVINAFELRDTNVSPSTLTPNSSGVNPTEEYVMVLDLVEIDGLDDIDTISFKFFNLDRPLSQIKDSFDSYTTTGIIEKDSSFPGFMLSNDAFVVTWNRQSDSFTLEGGSSTSWDLVQTTMTAVSSTNFVFEIQFRVSKVALNNNAWYIGALVSNGLVNQRPEDDFFFEGFYGMNWYGEIEVVSGTAVQWDKVDAGTDFYGPNTTASMISVSTGDLASVKYITNGYYQQRIFSSAQWFATEASLPLVGTNNFANLTTNSAQSGFAPQTFGIGVALDYDDINVNTRLDSVPITLRGHLLDLDSYNPILWRSRTLETGRTFSNLIFRVALANSFQNATYQGTINLGISNETDIIPADIALGFAATGPVTSEDYVGVYAENEEELKNLLANNNIQIPIYLRNGFIEITTAPAITISNTALKPVIGDVFITGDNISITNLTMLYGDLHIIGNSILLTNTQLTSHSPGGDLYVKGTQFTGSSINIEGSVFVSNNASAIITQDDTNNAVSSPLKIKENVFVSENSTLTINNYEIGSIINGRGNINVTGNSVIVLSNQTLFNDLNLHNSVGELQGSHFSGSGSRSDSFGRPLGINVNLYASHIDIQTASLESLNLRLGSTADKTNGLTNIVNLFTQSFFDMKNGVVDSMRIAEESTLHMLSGTVNERIRITTSEVIISGGTIGNSGDGNLNEYGILVDDLTSFSGTPSTLTISGNPTIKNIKARHQSTIDMSGGSITHITDLANQVNLTLLGGTIHYARTFNNAVIDMSAGTIRKAHLFNTTALNVSGGTLGNGNSNTSLISLNEQSTLDMYGGTINLGTMSNAKVDADFIDSSSDNRTETIVSVNSSNSKQGLQIRDDATVTLSGITIGSSTQLELRDNGSLTMQTDQLFDRMVKDYSSTFNEFTSTLGVNIRNKAQSVIEMYVRPVGGTTRPTRPGGNSLSSIAFDFDVIDGDENAASAFNKARELSSALGYRTNVYVVGGTYTEANPLMMDIDHLGLIFTTDGRTTKRSSNWTLTESLSSSVAKINQPVKLTGNFHVVHGIYFDLDAEHILISGSGVAFESDFKFNYVFQKNGTKPIIELNTQTLKLENNYLTRNLDSTNESVGVYLSGEFDQSLMVKDNDINAINNHAIQILQTGLEPAYKLNIVDNRIGTSSRSISGNAILFSSGAYRETTLSDNVIQNIALNAIEFTNVDLTEDLFISRQNISNVSGHAVVFRSDVTFDLSNHETRFSGVQFNTGALSYAAILFENVAYISPIRFTLSPTIQNAASALKIVGATTVSGITFNRGIFRNFSEDALHIQSTTIENLIFSHNDTLPGGHFLSTTNLAGTVTRGLIENVSQNAIYLEGTTLNGFNMNGFVIDDFALKGISYAGIDFNVQNVSGVQINQALLRVNTSVSNPNNYSFNRYEAIQVEFTGGLGPALRFNLDESNTYTNNTLFKPLIQTNAIGIEFKGALSSSDPVTKIFGSNAQFVVNANQEDLKTYVESKGINVIENTAVNNETGAGLINNGIELIDETYRLDLDAFRTAYAQLNAPVNRPLFISTEPDRQTLQSLDLIGLDGLAIEGGSTSILLQENNGGPELRTQFYQGNTSNEIVGSALDELRANNGNANILVTSPALATRAVIYVETLGGSVVTQSAVVSGGQIIVSVPVATISGNSFTVLFTGDPGTSTKYQIAIEWFDEDHQTISQTGIFLTTSHSSNGLLVSALGTSSIPIFEGLIDQATKDTIDSSVSTVAFYSNLNRNFQEFVTPNRTYANFLNLFAEVNAFEASLIAGLKVANTSLTTASGIPSSLIDDVIEAISGSSLTYAHGFPSNLVTKESFIERLVQIKVSMSAISESIWIIEDIIARRPYTTYFDFLDELETIVTALEATTIYDSNLIVLSPSALNIFAGTDLSVIQDLLNQDTNYPLYNDVETLIQVTNWDVVGGNWDSVKDTFADFTFEATYRWSDGSDMVFNIDRSITTVTISVTVSSLELVVATSTTSQFYTLQDAIDASSPGDEITLTKNSTEDVTLLTPVSINFNQNTLTGNLSINFTDDTTITFSGLGTITGDLTLNAPSLTLNSDLNVLGATNIIAIGSNSFNTSGVHTGVITLTGPGRINALNQVSRPSIRINTTSPVQIDGFVEDIDVDIDDVVVTINAALTRIRLNQRSTSQLTFGQGINFSRENLVFNQRLQRYYDSIQAAIDGASSGDTIEVGPGLYLEEIVIQNRDNLTIEGSLLGETILGPVRSYVVGNNGITIDNSQFITVRNLIIDGHANPSLGNISTFRDGVHYFSDSNNSNNTFENLVIRNIDRRGISIFPMTTTNTTIRNNRVENVHGINMGPFNGSIGINFQGTGLVENNTIVGIHTGIIHNSSVSNGLVEIKNNHISQFKDPVAFTHVSHLNIGINLWPRSTEKIILDGNYIESIYTRQIGFYLNHFAKESEVTNNIIVLTGENVIAIDALNNKNGGYLISGNSITVGAFSTGIALSTVGSEETPMVLGNNIIQVDEIYIRDQNFENTYEWNAFFRDTPKEPREVGILISGSNDTKRIKDTLGLAATYVTVQGNTINGFFEGIVKYSGIGDSSWFSNVSLINNNFLNIDQPRLVVEFSIQE